MVYQVTSAISASSPANDQLETIFLFLQWGFIQVIRYHKPVEKLPQTWSATREMNCGNFFRRTLLFLQKFIPSQDVSIYAREKLLHLEIRKLHWCLRYTLFMASYVGPGFPHTSTSFSGRASLQAPRHSSATSIYYSNNCVPVFCFLEQRRSRGLCLVFWTCSATFSISDSSTSNLSLPDSPPSTLLAPQLWVTAAASAVHTKTSVVLSFFDYTDN